MLSTCLLISSEDLYVRIWYFVSPCLKLCSPNSESSLHVKLCQHLLSWKLIPYNHSQRIISKFNSTYNHYYIFFYFIIKETHSYSTFFLNFTLLSRARYFHGCCNFLFIFNSFLTLMRISTLLIHNMTNFIILNSR